MFVYSVQALRALLCFRLLLILHLLIYEKLLEFVILRIKLKIQYRKINILIKGKSLHMTCMQSIAFLMTEASPFGQQHWVHKGRLKE